MKVIRIILLIFFVQTLTLRAQEIVEIHTSTFAEEMPKFDGGLNGFLIWVYQNIDYPQAAIDDSISGRVIAKFMIDTLGIIDKVEIIRGVREDVDQEVVRVIMMSPKWGPAMQHQKPICLWYSIPVDFSLRDVNFSKSIKKLSSKQKQKKGKSTTADRSVYAIAFCAETGFKVLQASERF